MLDFSFDFRFHFHFTFVNIESNNDGPTGAHLGSRVPGPIGKLVPRGPTSPSGTSRPAKGASGMSGMAGLSENKNGTASAKLPYDWFCFLFFIDIPDIPDEHDKLATGARIALLVSLP